MAVQTRLSWVLGLFILGTADVLLNWLNWADLSSEELHRGLIVGPPPYYMWVLLMVFTIISSLLYLLETFNTISVFFCNGTTKIPIVYEQLIVLPLEHIPLMAINFFLSRCRGQYMTSFQTFTGTIFIMYIFLRLVWYAHIEGKILHKNTEVQQKRGLFMLCCALYASAMAFPVMGWRNQLKVKNVHDQVYDISLYFMKAPFLENKQLSIYDISRILEEQGYNHKTNPVLEESVAMVTKSSPDLGTLAIYECNLNATFRPLECSTQGKIVFRFLYANFLEAGPYGEILYNFAFIPRHHGNNINNTCIPSEKNLQDGWKLFYLKRITKGIRSDRTVISSPWQEACTTPAPSYNQNIDVCGTDQVKGHVAAIKYDLYTSP